MPATQLYEVIYALHVAEWGKGLASETSRLIITKTFRLEEPLNSEIFAQVFPQNVKSISVLERLGMIFVERRLDSVSQRYASLYRESRDPFFSRHE